MSTALSLGIGGEREHVMVWSNPGFHLYVPRHMVQTSVKVMHIAISENASKYIKTGMCVCGCVCHLCVGVLEPECM